MTATDGQHFADVMPIEINLVETEGFQGDTSLNGENSAFKCKETGVAQRLAKILQQAEKNNRGKEEFPPTSSRYLANIHFPVFERIPQSFYVNETAPIGGSVFQVSISSSYALPVNSHHPQGYLLYIWCSTRHISSHVYSPISSISLLLSESLDHLLRLINFPVRERNG